MFVCMFPHTFAWIYARACEERCIYKQATQAHTSRVMIWLQCGDTVIIRITGFTAVRNIGMFTYA